MAIKSGFFHQCKLSSYHKDFASTWLLAEELQRTTFRTDLRYQKSSSFSSSYLQHKRHRSDPRYLFFFFLFLSLMKLLKHPEVCVASHHLDLSTLFGSSDSLQSSQKKGMLRSLTVMHVSVSVWTRRRAAGAWQTALTTLYFTEKCPIPVWLFIIGEAADTQSTAVTHKNIPPPQTFKYDTLQEHLTSPRLRAASWRGPCGVFFSFFLLAKCLFSLSCR